VHDILRSRSTVVAARALVDVAAGTLLAAGAIIERTTRTILERPSRTVIPTRTVLERTTRTILERPSRTVIPTRTIVERTSGTVIPTRAVLERTSRTVIERTTRTIVERPSRTVVVAARAVVVRAGRAVVVRAGRAVVATRAVVVRAGADGAGFVPAGLLLRRPPALSGRGFCALPSVRLAAAGCCGRLTGPRTRVSRLLLAVSRLEVLGGSAAGGLLVLGHGDSFRFSHENSTRRHAGDPEQAVRGHFENGHARRSALTIGPKDSHTHLAITSRCPEPTFQSTRLACESPASVPRLG